MLNNTIEGLITDYQEFIAENNLPVMSADELLLEVDLTEDQREFVNHFIEVWNTAMDGDMDDLIVD